MTTAATATHTITVVVVLLVLPSVLSSTLSSSGTDAQKSPVRILFRTRLLLHFLLLNSLSCALLRHFLLYFGVFAFRSFSAVFLLFILLGRAQKVDQNTEDKRAGNRCDFDFADVDYQSAYACN